MHKNIWPPFTQTATAPEPLHIKSAKGAVLQGLDGKNYLDCISSWWVNVHGHCHPKIAESIAKQASQLDHVLFAGCTHDSALFLAKSLCTLLPASLSRVFYSDNGSTAVEVALKMALQYFQNIGMPERRKILAFQGGYHGDTVGAMSVGAESGFFEPFRGIFFPVHHLPYPATWNDDDAVEAKETGALEALKQYLDTHGATTAAFIVEPLVQGASGMRFCRPEFLNKVLKLVREQEILLVFDEVMTGFGRLGSLFAFEQLDVTPDIICLAKGLTGGFLPLSVTVCGEKIYEAFQGDSFDKAFAHGHSYTANPIACAAGVASLEIFSARPYDAYWQAVEVFHKEQLARLQKAVGNPLKTRARGTIAALTIGEEENYSTTLNPLLKKAFLERGLLIRPLGNVIYLMPPYCTTFAQLEEAYWGIEAVLLSCV